MRIKSFIKHMYGRESTGERWRRKGLNGERKKSEMILWDTERHRRSEK